MALSDDLKQAVGAIYAERWDPRDGKVVPEADDLTLGNDAVKLHGVVLYADLNSSTRLVTTLPASIAAEIYKAFLYCAARIIRTHGGVVTAYDGDRIMAVFLGDSKNSNAAQTALKIHWCMAKLVTPLARAQYPGLTLPMLCSTVGVDRSDLFIAKTGVRGANDLVWVGRAANYAAKLSDVRMGSYRSWITDAVYGQMNKGAKLSTKGENMWTAHDWNGIRIYGSAWWRTP